MEDLAREGAARDFQPRCLWQNVPAAAVAVEASGPMGSVEEVAGGPLPGLGGAVDGDVFADDRAVADARARVRRGVEGKVLRIAADDREVVDAHARAEPGAGLDDRVRCDAAAGSERRAGLDDRERTDLDVGREAGGRVDLGGGMDHFGGRAVPNNSSWAALTIS